MSSEQLPIQGEVVRLLEISRGEGAVVAVMPAGAQENYHHFYAGVSRAPALSFLEALLLVLGGDRDEGGRRYEEIVVVNSGRAWSEGELDTPLEEVIHLRSGDTTRERGGIWDSWWYRKPPSLEPASPRGSDAPVGRPDPRGGLRGESRRAQYADISRSRSSAGAHDFPIKVSATETAEYLLKRYDELRQIIETLEESSKSHPTLLLIELAVLDYGDPGRIPPDSLRMTDAGVEKMDWLPKWIDGRDARPSHLDIVFYSRNRLRVEAFRQSGLPRRPSHFQGNWPALAYRGKNMELIEYPCGPFPWGKELFSGDQEGFSAEDGGPGDTPLRRSSYANRTLKTLLRGETHTGKLARVRFAAARPAPPPRPAPTPWISREFWSRLDLPMLRQAILHEYFGAEENSAVQRLLDTIQFMQQQAKEIEDPASFHHAVVSRWVQASTLLLWGKGGSGKSFLGKILGPLIYGHDGHMVSCQEASGGSGTDPNANFRSRFFGSATGYIGSDQPTDAGAHIIGNAGFTVLIFDEVNDISHGDFANSMEVLFGILQDRRYMPSNPALSRGGEPTSLWNSIILLTANLPSFPPPGVPAEKREAIMRRVSDYEAKLLDEKGAIAFAQWYLPKAVEKLLGGVAVCTCDDLTPEISQKGFKERIPDTLRKSLDRFAQNARDKLNEAGISAATCPLVLDITDALREVLR
jgi:hypothetical protein